MTGIAYQQLTEHYNIAMMIMFGLMVGVPGLNQLVIALRGGTPTDAPSTGSSSDASQRSESSTSSS